MFFNINYFDALIKADSLFWFCALAGSGMFGIQFLINLFGFADHNSFDTNGAVSDNAHGRGDDSVDVRKFKWLSMQTITGFLMMFGWSALTCQNDFELQAGPTLGISLAVGIFAALIMHSLFKLAKKLRSSGSIYRIEDAIGKEGYVYQCIPKGGKGKVSLSLHHFTHEIDAISHQHEDLPSFIRVKIIEKFDDNTVIVTPL